MDANWTLLPSLVYHPFDPDASEHVPPTQNSNKSTKKRMDAKALVGIVIYNCIVC